MFVCFGQTNSEYPKKISIMLLNKVHILLLLVTSALIVHVGDASSERSNDLRVTILQGASEQNRGITFYPEILPFEPQDTITWVNNDAVMHSVTSGVPAHPDYSGVFFKTNAISPAKSSTITTENLTNFAYYYFCEIHPWMTGKLVLATAPESLPDTDNAVIINEQYKQGSDVIVTGFVHKDFARTPYQILIYEFPDRLIDIKQSRFNDDASYSRTIHTGDMQPSRYLIKLVYGLPTQIAAKTFEVDEPGVVPKWMKIEAKMWAAGEISDQEFARSVEYLVRENTITYHATGMSQQKSVPAWFKMTSSWWADGMITDSEFAGGLQYLLGTGAIQI